VQVNMCYNYYFSISLNLFSRGELKKVVTVGGALLCPGEPQKVVEGFVRGLHDGQDLLHQLRLSHLSCAKTPLCSGQHHLDGTH